MPELNAKNLAEMFQGLAWNLHYWDFCLMLELEPEMPFSEARWQLFQQLCKDIKAFDHVSLNRMITKYYELKGNQQ